MKKLISGVLVSLAVLSFAPSIVRAETGGTPPAVVNKAPGSQGLVKPAPVENTPGQASDNYAAREAAAPAEVGEFEGGDSGVYIGGGVLTVVLIVVLIVILV